MVIHQVATIAVTVLGVLSGQGAIDVTPRGDDGILEAVIHYARSRGTPFDCVIASQGTSQNYVDLNPQLLQRLKRNGTVVLTGSDPKCDGAATALWVGPIDRVSARRASVAVGSLLPSMSGRPAYVLHKNWIGRWRVVGVLPAE